MTAPRRSAAFFDLDKTVIARSSTLAFTRPFYAGGLITRRAMLRSAYAHFFYQANGADHDQMERMRRHLSGMTTGWDVQQVRDIVAETLAELITPLVYQEATTLIAEHHAAGRDVVIVSASGADVVEPIGEMLAVDHVIATRMMIEDGRYTGEIEYYAYAENKAQAIRDLAEVEGYDLAESYAYSDSATDVPMLAAVGHAFAVNPDKPLRKEALARGWTVLDFTRPVRLRTRLQDRASARAQAARDRVVHLAELARAEARARNAETAAAEVALAEAASEGVAPAAVAEAAARPVTRPTTRPVTRAETVTKSGDRTTESPRDGATTGQVVAIGAGAATAAAAAGLVWLATHRRVPRTRVS